MSTDLIVEDGKVVFIHYTLTSDDNETIDSSAGYEPFAYLHGAANVVPGLETAMLGRKVGDKFDVSIPSKDGYGEHNGQEPQAVPLTDFPDDAELDTGMQFMAEMPDGELIPLWVSHVEDGQVFVDANHPLAGMTLNFAVEVINMRHATDEEKEHGHPHIGDHHHEE